MKVIIAGGGIGGLTTALMLRARNIDVQVYETAATIREAGVGINILPHAIRELEALGLLGVLDKVGLRTKSLTYFTKSGQEVWSELRGMHAAKLGPDFLPGFGEIGQAFRSQPHLVQHAEEAERLELADCVRQDVDADAGLADGGGRFIDLNVDIARP